MPCTTVLAGKLATNDRSTMIARTDDGHFDEKKLIVVEPDQQPKIYKSVESHVEITLPENPMRYTSCPSVDPKHGIWAATGINAANVGMTATETTTSNPRVLAADPMVELREAKDGEEERCGGIGEEDIVVLVLPYIRSAREGVLRLGALLEQYGTYESNGIAFNDENEVWWLETIGGHHWIAKKIPEDRVIINPNQFGMDSFDLEDAFGARESHLCSADLREFISENHLDLNQDGEFNPRDIFGSHRDMDHIYNTPRAWFMGRCLAPHTYRWDGENADFTPESDDIPWSYVPERKVAAEDIQYLLSSLSVLFDERYEELMQQPHDEMDCIELLCWLNQELFTTIENTVSIELLARLFSSQLVTKGEKHLLDRKRTYYRLLRQIVSQGQEREELTDTRTVSEIVKAYAMFERGLMYDWCLSGGEYSLVQYAREMMPLFLDGFRKK